MQKIRKKLMEIFKDGQTNQKTDQQTDSGDYIGPLQINQGPKWQVMLHYHHTFM